MTKLVITRGLPASGKTTWARAWVDEDAADRARVNRDDLRLNLYGAYHGLTADQENRVTDAQTASVRALLERGVSVVVDDTHLRLAHARRWATLARRLGVEFETVDVETPADVCVERDAARIEAGERGVGADVIRGMADRYRLRRGRWLPPVVLDPEPEPRLYEPRLDLPECWLVDVDGTLAHMDGRSPFEWHRVGEDSLDERIVDVVHRLRRDDDADGTHNPEALIVVVSGRDGVCRPETEEWLDRHGFDYDALFMRAAGDTRRDSVVKAELFWREIADRWHVLGVLDDRDQVVEMWRSLGLLCLQVAPGPF